MGESSNMYGIIMPSRFDKNNYEIYNIFQPIVLERLNEKIATICKITIEAGIQPGASINFETCKADESPKRKCVNFPSVDTAIIEAGRLAHNKMREGFRYRVAMADLRARLEKSSIDMVPCEPSGENADVGDEHPGFSGSD